MFGYFFAVVVLLLFLNDNYDSTADSECNEALTGETSHDLKDKGYFTVKQFF